MMAARAMGAHDYLRIEDNWIRVHQANFIEHGKIKFPQDFIKYKVLRRDQIDVTGHFKSPHAKAIARRDTSP